MEKWEAETIRGETQKWGVPSQSPKAKPMTWSSALCWRWKGKVGGEKLFCWREMLWSNVIRSPPLEPSLPGSCLQLKRDTCRHIFWELCSRLAKLELAWNLVLSHSLKSGGKTSHLTFPLPPTASPIFAWPRDKSFFAQRYLTVLPGTSILPSCFHSILLQLTLISLQQFRDTGLLSHNTFISSVAKIRMGVTLTLFLDSYSKISNVSLQI